MKKNTYDNNKTDTNNNTEKTLNVDELINLIFDNIHDNNIISSKKEFKMKFEQLLKE